MFLDDETKVLDVIRQTDFSVFFFDPAQKFPTIKRAITITPNERSSITIDEIRELTRLSVTKPTSEQIFVVSHADKLTEAATNACLKLLEETSELTHIAFFISNDANLLPTIKSRAHIYSLVKPLNYDTIDADAKLLTDAKLLIGSQPRDLVSLATKYKSDRDRAIELTAASIDLCYKSFFKTQNPKFLSILQRLLSLDRAIRSNGHVKLQLIANMV